MGGVEDFRARVWHPALTAAATPPDPLPAAFGYVGYRLPVEGDSHSDLRLTGVLRAGSGFLAYTPDGVTG